MTPLGGDNNKKAVNSKHAQKNRRELQTGEGDISDELAKNGTQVLQTAQIVAVELPIDRAEIPAVETHRVDDRQRRQVAHRRHRPQPLPREQIERREVAHCAHEDDERVDHRDEVENEQVGRVPHHLEVTHRFVAALVLHRRSYDCSHFFLFFSRYLSFILSLLD